MHRDIKPANILFTPDGPRLFDFGLAKSTAETKQIEINNFGTKSYKCPEVVFRMKSYEQSVDVWGLGLIFAEMILNKEHILEYKSDRLTLNQMGSFCGLKDADRRLISA
jgi:serine/threonine protein kinase